MRLEHPTLDGTKVTDASLAFLSGMKRLQSLRLGRVRKITGAGLESLKRLKKLEDLSLDGTSVNDAGLKIPRAIEEPEVLHLGETRITDAGLKSLGIEEPEVAASRGKPESPTPGLSPSRRSANFVTSTSWAVDRRPQSHAQGVKRSEKPCRSARSLIERQAVLIGILIPRNVPNPNVDADRCRESAPNSRNTPPVQWVRYHAIRRVALLAWLCVSLPPGPSRFSALDRAKEAIGWVVLRLFSPFGPISPPVGDRR